MCMRSSSALVAHIHPCMRRYSSRVALTVSVEPPVRSGLVPETGRSPVPPPGSAASALTGIRLQRPRDPGDFLGSHAHTLQVVVVPTLKVREIRALGPLLPQALDLLHHPGDQWRL